MAVEHHTGGKASGVELLSGETVCETIRPSWTLWKRYILLAWSLLIGGGVAGIVFDRWRILVGGVGLSLLVLLVVYLARRQNRYVVTDQRIIERRGLIRFSTREIPLDQIRNIRTRTHLVGRLFGYGRIEIESSPTAGRVTLPAVSSHRSVVTTIREQQQNRR